MLILINIEFILLVDYFKGMLSINLMSLNDGLRIKTSSSENEVMIKFYFKKHSLVIE